jgi:threonine synthase
MKPAARYACFAGCAERYALDEVVYRCRRCGALLDVEHDLEALRARGPAAWMKLFDERWMRTAWPYGSGRVGQAGVGATPTSTRQRRELREGGTNLLGPSATGAPSG